MVNIFGEMRRLKTQLEKIEMAKVNAKRREMGLPPIRPWFVPNLSHYKVARAYGLTLAMFSGMRTLARTPSPSSTIS